MRITAGVHRSRTLKTLKSDHTRPTSDKIRQAIFSKVGPFFQEGSFLDVFCGTGAMGLEALSRGMDRVLAFENHGPAAAIINENVKLLKEEKNFKLMRGDAQNLIQKDNGLFDIVFMDPPYDYKDFDLMISLIVKHAVHDDSIIIVESDSQHTLKESYSQFTCTQEKVYGHTKLCYFEVCEDE